MERLFMRVAPEPRPAPRPPARAEQVFYGWFDEAGQVEPSYEPPRDAPCPYCGKPLHAADVRTHSIMWSGPVYGRRSYFYRTHASCDETGHGKGLAMDGFIWDMIARNGD